MSVAAAFETQAAMADAFGVSQPTVWRWINQSRQLPAQYVLTAERLTGVSRHHLRPDIYPPEHAASSKPYTMLADRSQVVTLANGTVSSGDTSAPHARRAAGGVR